MTSYAFKEWLTFEEAAAWLTDTAGKPFDAKAISRAALNNLLPVHYWPTDDAEIGLFRVRLMSRLGDIVESPLHLNLEHCEVVCLVDGPVPFRRYRLFHSAIHNIAPSRPIGISAFPDEPELYGCYRIDEAGRPQCMAQGNYQVLVHISDLEQLSKGLQMPAVSAPHDLLLGVAHLDATEQVLYLARSAANWSNYPDADLPIVPPLPDPETRSEPLLRALGFAAHLIAELGQKLDEHEQLQSRRRRYTVGASPNVSTIAQALADTAAKLRYEGHNFKGAGFTKLLRQALREIE